MYSEAENLDLDGPQLKRGTAMASSSMIALTLAYGPVALTTQVIKPVMASFISGLSIIDV